MADPLLQQLMEESYREPEGEPARPYEPGDWQSQLVRDLENLIPKPGDTEDQLMYKLNMLGATTSSAGLARGAVTGAVPGAAAALIGPRGAKRLVEKGRLPMEALEGYEGARAMHQKSPPFYKGDELEDYYQEMWSKFGWAPGAEGTLRTEVPNRLLPPKSKESIPAGRYSLRLEKLLKEDSPILDAYPGMRRVPLHLNAPPIGEPSAGYGGGRFLGDPQLRQDLMYMELPRSIDVSKASPTVISDKEFAKNYIEMLSHELQHGIQAREGVLRRPTGAAGSLDLNRRSPKEFTNLEKILSEEYGIDLGKTRSKDEERELMDFLRYFVQAPEVEARNAALRETERMFGNKDILRVAPPITEDVPRHLQSLFSAQPWHRGQLEQILRESP